MLGITSVEVATARPLARTNSAMQQSVGHYQIIERIASGGQATVFQAYDTSTGRIVALKLLHPHLAENEAYLTRFLREARLAAEVAHPNVVRIFEVGREADSHFIAMEYLPRSLADLMQNHPQMPIERVVDIARQIAGALEAARARGVVHRDIKPANVLIGPNAEAKLTDFGISRAIEDVPLTRTGAAMGTPQYMSPEQAQGEPVDSRSDIYSLGVMLYQMLAGAVPFDAKTPFEVIRKHINEPARPLRQLRPDAPVALQRIVSRCMAKAPARRYQTPADLDAALARAFIDSNAVPKEPEPLARPADEDTDRTITIEVPAAFVGAGRRWRRAASWVRNRPVWAASVAVTTIVLSVAAVAGALFVAGDPSTDAPATLLPGGIADDGGGGDTPPDQALAGPAPTPTPSPTPAASPTPEPPAAFDGTYVLGMFLVQGDGPFQLRMGSEPYWGYFAEQRIDTGQTAIVMGPIQVGETISFDACRSRRTTEPHHLTIEKLGVDYNLDSAEIAGPAEERSTGARDDPNNNCEFTFDAPGEYLIDDDLHPGAHGVAKIIVEG